MNISIFCRSFSDFRGTLVVMEPQYSSSKSLRFTPPPPLGEISNIDQFLVSLSDREGLAANGSEEQAMIVQDFDTVHQLSGQRIFVKVLHSLNANLHGHAQSSVGLEMPTSLQPQTLKIVAKTWHDKYGCERRTNTGTSEMGGGGGGGGGHELYYI